jgi:hypothetical protein
MGFETSFTNVLFMRPHIIQAWADSLFTEKDKVKHKRPTALGSSLSRASLGASTSRAHHTQP